MRKLIPVKRVMAEYLSIGNSKFYDLVRDGEIEVVKLGNRSYVTEEELDRFTDEVERRSRAARASESEPVDLDLSAEELEILILAGLNLYEIDEGLRPEMRSLEPDQMEALKRIRDKVIRARTRQDPSRAS